MREYIRSTFPEINQIKEEEIQEMVISAFEKAMEIGKWEKNELEQIPFTMLIQDLDTSFVEHTRVVTRLAIAAGKELEKVGIPISW
ncbi:MAG: phosphohydrolase, partial [Promethearchaeota archaeon]